MALTITTTYGVIIWNMGDSLKNVFPASIVSIQADKNELIHILNQYESHFANRIYSIPVPKDQKMITWYGDLAKTIVANL